MIGGTDPDFIASCFFAYSTSLFVKDGKILGKDMSHYEDMLKKVKAAVRERFTKDYLPLSRTQTACVLLHFDITDNPDGGEGDKKVVLSPVPDERLGFVKASIETAFGKLASSWRYQDDYIRYEFEVPEGMTAAVKLETEDREVSGGRYVFFEKR